MSSEVASSRAPPSSRSALIGIGISQTPSLPPALPTLLLFSPTFRRQKCTEKSTFLRPNSPSFFLSLYSSRHFFLCLPACEHKPLEPLVLLNPSYKNIVVVGLSTNSIGRWHRPKANPFLRGLHLDVGVLFTVWRGDDDVINPPCCESLAGR